MGEIVILSIGAEARLLLTRNMVLQAAGYAVVAANSIKEAVGCIQDGEFDLVLLCQSIPTKDKDRLIDGIRASGSRIPVVSVSGQLCQVDAAASMTVGSDPIELLRGLREVLISARTAGAGTSSNGAYGGGTCADRTATPHGNQDGATRQGKMPARSSDDAEMETATAKEPPSRLPRTG